MKNNMLKTLLYLTLIGCINSPVCAQDTGKIYYHLSFPVTITEQSESIALNENYKDLIMSNFVAGAIYAHLIHEHFPDLKFDPQYLEGSIFAQLLQENLQTSDYQSQSDWINPNPDIRNMLLMPGQGGPYQLNDYSKRLENKIGMINFTVLQKSLGYTIEDQDSGKQTTKNGPLTLDNKYFGPVAAAYFQYNDLLRLESINSDPWGPSGKYFSGCMKNLATIENNFLDMILNATYNAGPWSDINEVYIELCANYFNSDYADRIKHINDYTLGDSDYQKAIGTKESAGSTFILYPRQTRFYLDELYNNPTVLKTLNSLSFSMVQLKDVFAKVMGTIAYVNSAGKYDFINKNDADLAFDNALAALHISSTQLLDISDAGNKDQIFKLLEMAVANVTKSLNIKLSEVTEQNH